MKSMRLLREYAIIRPRAVYREPPPRGRLRCRRPWSTPSKRGSSRAWASYLTARTRRWRRGRNLSSCSAGSSVIKRSMVRMQPLNRVPGSSPCWRFRHSRGAVRRSICLRSLMRRRRRVLGRWRISRGMMRCISVRRIIRAAWQTWLSSATKISTFESSLRRTRMS